MITCGSRMFCRTLRYRPRGRRSGKHSGWGIWANGVDALTELFVRGAVVAIWLPYVSRSSAGIDRAYCGTHRILTYFHLRRFNCVQRPLLMDRFVGVATRLPPGPEPTAGRPGFFVQFGPAPRKRASGCPILQHNAGSWRI